MTSSPDKPLIGLTAGAALPDHSAYVSIRSSYIAAIERAGGAPVVVPPTQDPETLRAILSRLHGIVFPGGGDVEPSLYGEDRHPLTHVNPALDRLELFAAEWAVSHHLPTLGICRGQQLLNVALGGTLQQDLPSLGVPGHQQEASRRAALTHTIRIEPGSRLAALLGTTECQVNSLHHQAVGQLGRGLRPVAWSDDGVIEGLEFESEGDQHPWLVAVQFHPEELVGFHAPSLQLLGSFVSHCATFHPLAAGTSP